MWTREQKGVAFVDLSAAYDTQFNTIQAVPNQGSTGTEHGTYDFGKSYILRWIIKQEEFNINTNEQLQPPLTRSFLYADDLALAVQSKSFENI